MTFVEMVGYIYIYRKKDDIICGFIFKGYMI